MAPVSDYSTTAADNTAISGLAVSNATVISTVDDIIRQLMADIRAADNANVKTSRIGTTVQAYDADLAAIAALPSAANKVPYSTGAGAWALANFTAAGRALVEDTSAAAQRVTLGIYLPKNASGQGQWNLLFAATNTAIVLPAGGTWAYFALLIDNTFGTVVNNGVRAGVAPGGAGIGGPVVNAQGYGFAWRIT